MFIVLLGSSERLWPGCPRSVLDLNLLHLRSRTTELLHTTMFEDLQLTSGYPKCNSDKNSSHIPGTAEKIQHLKENKQHQ
jgi:hypothetical protein